MFPWQLHEEREGLVFDLYCMDVSKDGSTYASETRIWILAQSLRFSQS